MSVAQKVGRAEEEQAQAREGGRQLFLSGQQQQRQGQTWSTGTAQRSTEDTGSRFAVIQCDWTARLSAEREGHVGGHRQHGGRIARQ